MSPTKNKLFLSPPPSAYKMSPTKTNTVATPTSSFIRDTTEKKFKCRIKRRMRRNYHVQSTKSNLPWDNLERSGTRNSFYKKSDFRIRIRKKDSRILKSTESDPVKRKIAFRKKVKERKLKFKAARKRMTFKLNKLRNNSLNSLDNEVPNLRSASLVQGLRKPATYNTFLSPGSSLTLKHMSSDIRSIKSK